MAVNVLLCKLHNMCEHTSFLVMYTYINLELNALIKLN
jgi:hypothetical protein